VGVDACAPPSPASVDDVSPRFDKVGIDTSEVLESAGTKWNFLKFRPGPVGGHCMSTEQIAAKVVAGGCFVDVKAGFDADALRAAGLCVWRL
jgi:hypothetical protein